MLTNTYALRRYGMFGLLYFTQGTIFSYFTALNALYLLENDLTMSDVGIFSFIAMIPFMLKVFLGIVSDRYSLLNLGHRRPYILLGLAIQFSCLLIVPLLDPSEQYWMLVVVAFLLQTGMALYDTCTDGLALDTTDEAEQGLVQGMMVGGRALGVVVAAAVVGLLADYVGWSAVFITLAVFTVLPVPLVLKAREPEYTHEREFDWSAFRAFKQRNVLALAGLGFILFMVITGANQLVNPFLEDTFNIELSDAGFTTTLWGIGMVFGSILGSTLEQRSGKRSAVWVGMGISSVAVGALALITVRAVAWGLVALFGIAYGTYMTIYFSLSMNYTDLRIAATMFAILMAFTNVADGIGMAVSGILSDAVGFRITFVMLAALNLLAIPLIPLIFEKHDQPVTAADFATGK